MALSSSSTQNKISWNNQKLHRKLLQEIRTETDELLIKNITAIDVTSNPIRVKKKDLQRSINENNHIIAFVEPILKDISNILEDNVIFGLLDSEGTLISSGNKDKIGLSCPDSVNLISNRGEFMELLADGQALQMNLGHGSQSGGLAILDNNGFIKYHLMVRNDSGPLTTNSWNVLYLVWQLIQQHYYSLLMLEDYSDSFIQSILDPAILLDHDLRPININEPCMELLEIENSDLSTELNNIRFISDNRRIKNLIAVLNTSDYVTIKTRKKYFNCDIKNKHLMDTPYGKNLILLLENAKAAGSIWRLDNRLNNKPSYFDSIIGTSPAIQKIKSIARQIAETPSTILIEGETGTGKELLAEAIHKESKRKGKFIAVNCGGIPSELLQSELFGYEEGAFTGAKKGGKLGLFEIADDGTIFLDEIGEMPFELQVNLLRFVQNKMINRIGSEVIKEVDVRIVAATNRDLKNEIQNGNFREDLYYRLNVINFKLPALRDRKEDIPLIADFILGNLCNQYETPILELSKHNIRSLMNYEWPGNIRELANIIERAFLLRIGDQLDFDEIFKNGQMTDDILDRNEALDKAEKEVIEKYLQFYEGKIALTAEALNMTRQTLYRKIKKFNIDRSTFC